MGLRLHNLDRNGGLARGLLGIPLSLPPDDPDAILVSTTWAALPAVGTAFTPSNIWTANPMLFPWGWCIVLTRTSVAGDSGGVIKITGRTMVNPTVDTTEFITVATGATATYASVNAYWLISRIEFTTKIAGAGTDTLIIGFELDVGGGISQGVATPFHMTKATDIIKMAQMTGGLTAAKVNPTVSALNVLRQTMFMIGHADTSTQPIIYRAYAADKHGPHMAAR